MRIDKFQYIDKIGNYIEKVAKKGYLRSPDYIAKLIMKDRIQEEGVSMYKNIRKGPESDSYKKQAIENIYGMTEVLNRYYKNNWTFTLELLTAPKRFCKNTAMEDYRKEILDFSMKKVGVWGYEGYQEIMIRDKESIILNDIYSYPFITFSLGILIRFPEITIRNSRLKSHVIKDLIICLPLVCRRNLLPATLRGVRLTVTLAELKKRYQHSHLSTSRFPSSVVHDLKATNFCLGEGNIAFLLGKFISVTTFERRIFERLLMEIETFVAWESLEGVAYINMETIKEAVITNIRPTSSEPLIQGDSEEVIDGAVQLLCKDPMYKNLLVFYKEDGKFRISPTESLEKAIHDWIKSKYPIFYEANLLAVVEGGYVPKSRLEDFYNPILDPQTEREIKYYQEYQKIVYFGNEELVFQVVDEPKKNQPTEKIEYKIKLNSKIYDSIRKFAETFITYYLFRSDCNER